MDVVCCEPLVRHENRIRDSACRASNLLGIVTIEQGFNPSVDLAKSWYAARSDCAEMSQNDFGRWDAKVVCDERNARQREHEET